MITRMTIFISERTLKLLPITILEMKLFSTLYTYLLDLQTRLSYRVAALPSQVCNVSDKKHWNRVELISQEKLHTHTHTYMSKSSDKKKRT